MKRAKDFNQLRYFGVNCHTPISDIVNNWSFKRDAVSINAKIFAIEPAISLKLWTSSYQ